MTDMAKDMAMKANWSEQLRREPAAAAALAFFVLSAATMLGAWYFQYVLKLAPCPLCLEERLPYHIVIPLSLLMAIAAIVRAPRALIVVGFLAIMAAMLVQRRPWRLSRRRRMALVAGPDRLFRPDFRFHGERTAAEPIAIGSRGALRRSGLAFSRPFARRL